MNKQLTKRNIGIAASAALMASAAFSGNALAAKGGNPQVSLGVSSWCEIKYEDQAAGKMTVYYTILDKSSGIAANTGQLNSVEIEAVTKERKNDWYPLTIEDKDDTSPTFGSQIPLEGSKVAYGDPDDATDNPDPMDVTISPEAPAEVFEVQLNVCGDNLGKSLNAELTVTLLQPEDDDTVPYPSSNGEYTAQCGSHPGADGQWGTADDFTGGLKVADYVNLCTQ